MIDTLVILNKIIIRVIKYQFYHERSEFPPPPEILLKAHAKDVPQFFN